MNEHEKLTKYQMEGLRKWFEEKCKKTCNEYTSINNAYIHYRHWCFYEAHLPYKERCTYLAAFIEFLHNEMKCKTFYYKFYEVIVCIQIDGISTITLN